MAATESIMTEQLRGGAREPALGKGREGSSKECQKTRGEGRGGDGWGGESREEQRADRTLTERRDTNTKGLKEQGQQIDLFSQGQEKPEGTQPSWP